MYSVKTIAQMLPSKGSKNLDFFLLLFFQTEFRAKKTVFSLHTVNSP